MASAEVGSPSIRYATSPSCQSNVGPANRVVAGRAAPGLST
jgi:hypothetical protein